MNKSSSGEILYKNKGYREDRNNVLNVTVTLKLM